MSRGKKGFLSGLALLSLGGLLLLGSPAGAQLVTSGEAAGEDNIPPEPVDMVTVDTTLVGDVQAIEVSWPLSASDLARQQPAGSDVTSGGTFIIVNDVAEYRIWRVESGSSGGADTTLVGRAGAGETSFIDDALPEEARGMTFRYLVAAADAAGNQSAGTVSAEISIGAPELQLSTYTIAWAYETVGVPTQRRTLTISNVGELPLTGTMALDGDRDRVFNVSPNTFALEADQELEVLVTFTPRDTLSYSATLVITSNDPTEPEATVSVDGGRVFLQVVGQPTTKVGDQQVTQEFTFKLGVDATVLDNPVGRQNLQDVLCAEIRLSTGIPDFDCSRVNILAIRPGSTIVEFEILPDPTPGAPTPGDVLAAFNEALQENPNALAEAAEALGIDIDFGPVLETATISFTSIDFDSLGPSQTASETITIGNASSDPASVVSGTIQVAGLGFSATESSFAVASRDSVSFDVVFTAAAVSNANGTYTGSATVSMNDGSQTVIGLSATIVGGLRPPDLDLSAVTLNFAAVEVDSLKSITLTISNRGGVPLRGTLALAGDAVFSVSETSFALDAAEDVDVEITFAPTDSVAYSGTLTITSNDPAQPVATVTLAGIGVPAGFVPALPGDFNNSGSVDFDDFFMFADNFGTNSSSPIWDPMFDLVPSGEVDFDDFFVFADNFGRSL